MSRVHSDELLAQTQFSVQKQTNFSYKKYSKLTSCVTRTPTFWAYDRKNNSDFPSTYTEDTLKRSFKIDRERTDLGTDSGSGPIWVNRIGSGPVKIGHRSSANSPFRPSFVLSNAVTTHSHRWHKAVISLCRRLLCNHGPRPRPRPFHTRSGERVGVFQREVLQ